MHDDAVSPTIGQLEDKARLVRIRLLRMVVRAQAGHLGGSLSAADIITALYFKFLSINPEHPEWEDRDRFVLSKGHATPVYYSVLSARGFFPDALLDQFDVLDSPLQGHPDMRKTPGVDMTTGSLGQGFSAAIGMCIGRDLVGKDFHVYVLAGDGELQEGQIWEAALYAGSHHLRNLICIVDCNGLQLASRIVDALPLAPLAEKWRSFGWNVLSCDGNEMGRVVKTIQAAQKRRNGPTVILARTTKGKGVSFMENEVVWHSRCPSPDELSAALSELGASSGEQVR
jgi:transketolase